MTHATEASEELDQDEALEEALIGCEPGQAETYAKACWLGKAQDAMEAALAADLEPELARFGFEMIQADKSNSTPYTDTTEQLELDIRWRPGDGEIFEELGQGSEGYLARFQLVLFGLCDYGEADLIVPHLQRKLLGEAVETEPVDLDTVLANLAAGHEFPYLFRLGPVFWRDILDSDQTFNPVARRMVSLDKIHQIWRLKPLAA